MRVAGWLGGVWLAATVGCFHEAAGSTDGGGCPPGTLGCPCDGGGCDAQLTCEPSIDRCVEAGCDPGQRGCSCAMGQCLGGAVCTDGVCIDGSAGTSGGSSGGTTAGTSGTTGMGSLSTTLQVEDSGVTDTLSSGPTFDLGLLCEPPACAICGGDCETCLGCVASPTSACAQMCAGDEQCLALAACAADNPDLPDYVANCCDLPCDEVCAAQQGLWHNCAEAACACAANLGC